MFSAKKRMSAEEALVEPYFFTEPLPAHHSDLPIPVRGEHEVSVPRSWLRSLAHTHTHGMHCRVRGCCWTSRARLGWSIPSPFPCNNTLLSLFITEQTAALTQAE